MGGYRYADSHPLILSRFKKIRNNAMHIRTPLSRLPGIQPFHLTRLKKLGIFCVEDLVRHFPARYDDYSTKKKIQDIIPNTRCTVEGIVQTFFAKRSWQKKMLISEAALRDDTGTVRAVWFGKKFLDKIVIPGKSIRISGKAVQKDGEILFLSPECESAEKNTTHTGGIIAIYPETEGLTSKWLRWKIQSFLKIIVFPPDILPKDIRERLHLPSQKQAFFWIHTPKTLQHATLAQKYFAFEEMFLLQIFILRDRLIQTKALSKPIPKDDPTFQTFLSSLPFRLTSDQKKAMQTIVHDLSLPQPMNRLLNGDVGSGKTIVAIASARHIAQKGFQTVLLAPTEILALQHFHSFQKLLSQEHCSIGLFTRNYHYLAYPGKTQYEKVRRPQLLDALKIGLIDIVIGTHALLQEDIVFKNLVLVIIDEQHRFGVEQRAWLQVRSRTIQDGTPNQIPHLLTMTATPIPRTLSLILLGNLDISILETKPKDRLPIITRIIHRKDREPIYAFIRKSVLEGRQCYIILPFVEESETITNVKAAITEHKRLQKDIFPDLSLGLLHGRLKAHEKEDIMETFKQGKTHILVSTSVVEVGVDVPNATLMIIENADRFGLSQLHQFRGRIGRGIHQSFCFLFTSDIEDQASKRMHILEKTANGFIIAEEDMKLRGPGQFLGTRQSGIPDSVMANIHNMKLITIAQGEAKAILDNDPDLQMSPEIKKSLDTIASNAHFE